MTNLRESPNAVFRRFVQGISDADCNLLRGATQEDVSIDVPGARFVDITTQEHGVEALCEWARKVRTECGLTTFVLHRYFENGCELMANGVIRIDRLPQSFQSPCSIHVRFESGKIAAFQLLLDTYALQKFRGETD